MNSNNESFMARHNRMTYGFPERPMGKSASIKTGELLRARFELNFGLATALASGENTLGFEFLGYILDEAINRETRRAENAPYQDIVLDAHREDQVARLALHQQIVGF